MIGRRSYWAAALSRLHLYRRAALRAPFIGKTAENGAQTQLANITDRLRDPVLRNVQM